MPKDRAQRAIDSRNSAGSQSLLVGAAFGTVSSGLITHTLDGTYHSGLLSWAKVDKGSANLADLPTRNYSDLQNRAHNIVSEHTATGAQYSVIGLSATNTLGVLATANDGTGNNNVILRSNASGGLSLNGLITPTILSAAGNLAITPASGILQINNIISTATGSAAAPTHTFTGDTDTGVYQGGADVLGFATGGVERAKLSNTVGLQVTATTTETAQGVDSFRIGIVAGTPRIILEDATYTPWEIDSSAGSFRIFNPGVVRFTLASDGSIISANDTDTANVFGRVKIGYAGTYTDDASFGHYDRFAAATYTLRATSAGDTYLNASTGRTTYFANNNATFMSMTSAALTIENGKIIQTPSFVSGFVGNGFRLDQGVSVAGYTHLELDNLTVRGTMRVYELLVQQIRATNGSIFVTSAAKIATATAIGGLDYRLVIDGDNSAIQPFAVNDKIRAQRLQLGSGAVIWRSDLTVTAINVGGNAKTFDATLVSGTTAPGPGMEFVRLGNSSNTSRQGGIYLTADDSGAPFIDVFNGIAAHTDWNTTGKVKLRLGLLTGITGTANEYGLIAGVNGFGTNDSWFKTSTSGFEQRNSTSKWFVSGVEELRIDPTTGIEIRLAANDRNAISWNAAIGDGSPIALVSVNDDATFGRGIGVNAALNNQNLMASASLSATNNYYTGKTTTRFDLWNGIPAAGGTYFDNVASLSAKQLRFGYSSVAGGGKIYFTNVWSASPDGADTGIAEISSDTGGTYNGLMVVGNKSAGNGYRNVLMYDRLGIGTTIQATSGSLTVNGGIQAGQGGMWGAIDGPAISGWVGFGTNFYYSGDTAKYRYTNYASQIFFNNTMYFRAAPSGTAGSNIAFSDVLVVGPTGGAHIYGSDAAYWFADRLGSSPTEWAWYASGGIGRLYNNSAGDILQFSGGGNMVQVAGTYQNNAGSIKSYTTNAGNGLGGTLYLQTQKATTPAQYDMCGSIKAFAYNSINNDTDYVSQYMQVYNPAYTNEQGAWFLWVRDAGVINTRLAVIGRNFGIRTTDFASGVGVIGIGNVVSTPSTTPSGGGVLYVENGALKYKGDLGTVTTLAAR